MYLQQFLICTCLITYGFTLPATNLHPRIVNGTKSTPQPWIAQFVKIENNGEIIQHCGGSLISPRLVITAAHCFINADGTGTISEDLNTILVFIGSNQFMGGKQYKIQKILQTPEKFNVDHKLLVINDIILVELDANVPNDVAIGINLPTDEKFVVDSKPAYTYGWGHTTVSAWSDYLLTTNGYIIPQKICYDSFADPKKICFNSTENYSAICHGDSGGPLTIHDGVVSILVGIVSFGDCDSQQLFTRVSSYLNWISENIS